MSSRSVRLSWKPPLLSNETVAYAILWAEVDFDKTERSVVVTKGVTTFVFDELLPHRLYSFRVQSMLSEGPGGSTEKIVARPYSDKPGKPPRDVFLKYSNSSVSIASSLIISLLLRLLLRLLPFCVLPFITFFVHLFGFVQFSS